MYRDHVQGPCGAHSSWSIQNYIIDNLPIEASTEFLCKLYVFQTRKNSQYFKSSTLMLLKTTDPPTTGDSGAADPECAHLCPK